jgi:5'-deoxynucleotidase
LPTPVKYFSGEIRNAYKAIEGHAVEQLLKLLPADLRADYEPLLEIPEGEKDSKEIIKAADTICAYIKCLEEKAAGNLEFSRAQKSIEEKLKPYLARPEVDYFMKNFVSSFSLTLDEISRPLEL